MPRVLVTRPEPGASATAEKLRHIGAEPVLLPLSKTAPLEPGTLTDASEFDAVAVTSANALRHAPAHLMAQYASVPCLTVGARTAGVAREAGFSSVKSADGNADALASMIEQMLPAKSRILYLCGQSRRPALETALGAAGYAVTALETYRTGTIDYTPGELEQALDGGSIDAVLLYSPHAAARLSDLLTRTNFEWLETARILCMSSQIAEALEQELKGRAEIAATPHEKSLLGCLI